MKLLFLCALVGTVVHCKPGGYFRQEYQFKKSSATYQNNQLQTKDDDQGFYHKQGDLEGPAKVQQHNEQSQYVSPDLGGLGQTVTSYDNRDLTEEAERAFNNHGLDVQGLKNGGGGSYSSYSSYSSYETTGRANLQNLKQNLQRNVEECLREAMAKYRSEGSYRSQAYMENQLKANVTRLMQEALYRANPSSTATYTITATGVYNNQNQINPDLTNLRNEIERRYISDLYQELQRKSVGRTRNYDSEEIEDLNRQTKIGSGYSHGAADNYNRQSYSHNAAEDYNRQHGYTGSNHYVGSNMQRRAFSQSQSSYGESQVTERTSYASALNSGRGSKPNYNTHSANTGYQPIHVQINPNVHLTDIMQNVQNTIHRQISEALRTYEEKYSDTSSYRLTNSRPTYDAALSNFKEQIRHNLTDQIQRELERNYGVQTKLQGYSFSLNAGNTANYKLDDFENLKRTVEKNLEEFLENTLRTQETRHQQQVNTASMRNRDYTSHGPQFTKGLTDSASYTSYGQQSTRGSSDSYSSYGTKSTKGSTNSAAYSTHNSQELEEITRRLQAELSRQLQKAVEEHKRTQSYTQQQQNLNTQDLYQELESELKRNITEQLQKSLRESYGNQGRRGGFSYTVTSGVYNPSANYRTQDLDSMMKQMQLDLEKQLREQMSSGSYKVITSGPYVMQSQTQPANSFKKYQQFSSYSHSAGDVAGEDCTENFGDNLQRRYKRGAYGHHHSPHYHQHEEFNLHPQSQPQQGRHQHNHYLSQQQESDNYNLGQQVEDLGQQIEDPDLGQRLEDQNLEELGQMPDSYDDYFELVPNKVEKPQVQPKPTYGNPSTFTHPNYEIHESPMKPAHYPGNTVVYAKPQITPVNPVVFVNPQISPVYANPQVLPGNPVYTNPHASPGNPVVFINPQISSGHPSGYNPHISSWNHAKPTTGNSRSTGMDFINSNPHSLTEPNLSPHYHSQPQSHPPQIPKNYGYGYPSSPTKPQSSSSMTPQRPPSFVQNPPQTPTNEKPKFVQPANEIPDEEEFNKIIDELGQELENLDGGQQLEELGQEIEDGFDSFYPGQQDDGFEKLQTGNFEKQRGQQFSQQNHLGSTQKPARSTTTKPKFTQPANEISDDEEIDRMLDEFGQELENLDGGQQLEELGQQLEDDFDSLYPGQQDDGFEKLQTGNARGFEKPQNRPQISQQKPSTYNQKPASTTPKFNQPANEIPPEDELGQEIEELNQQIDDFYGQYIPQQPGKSNFEELQRGNPKQQDFTKPQTGKAGVLEKQHASGSVDRSGGNKQLGQELEDLDHLGQELEDLFQKTEDVYGNLETGQVQEDNWGHISQQNEENHAGVSFNPQSQYVYNKLTPQSQISTTQPPFSTHNSESSPQFPSRPTYGNPWSSQNNNKIPSQPSKPENKPGAQINSSKPVNTLSANYDDVINIEDLIASAPKKRYQGIGLPRPTSTTSKPIYRDETNYDDHNGFNYHPATHGHNYNRFNPTQQSSFNNQNYKPSYAQSSSSLHQPDEDSQQIARDVYGNVRPVNEYIDHGDYLEYIGDRKDITHMESMHQVSQKQEDMLPKRDHISLEEARNMYIRRNQDANSPRYVQFNQNGVIPQQTPKAFSRDVELSQKADSTESLTQQSEDFGQQFQDLTQQIEHFGQRSEDFHDLTQQSEDLTQQSEDLTQQIEDLTQQSEDLTQQSEDLTQNFQSVEDFTQRPIVSYEPPRPYHSATINNRPVVHYGRSLSNPPTKPIEANHHNPVETMPSQNQHEASYNDLQEVEDIYKNSGSIYSPVQTGYGRSFNSQPKLNPLSENIDVVSSTTEEIIAETEPPKPASFWKSVGGKISSSFSSVKQKAKDLIG